MYDFESMHAKKVAQRQQRKKRMMLSIFTLSVILVSFYAGWNRLWLNEYQNDKPQDPIPAPNVIANSNELPKTSSNAAGAEPAKLATSATPVDKSKMIISVGIPKKANVDTTINTSNNQSTQ